jgi:hypothetical protein
MREPIDDSLTQDQLRQVDRWTAISLVSFGAIAMALLAALLLGGSTPARSEFLGKLDVDFEGHYALETSGQSAEQKPDSTIPRIDMRAILADPTIRDFIGLSENAWDFSSSNGLHGFGPLDSQDASSAGAQKRQ